MTHKEITRAAVKWLKSHPQNIIIPNCSIVAEEVKTATITGEIADVIGWCSWASVLIEIKTSREDFLKDKKKPFRKEIERGMGNFKYYLAPSGVLTKKDLPQNWGLLIIDSKGKINIEQAAINNPGNLISERTVLLSLFRKLKRKEWV